MEKEKFFIPQENPIPSSWYSSKFGVEIQSKDLNCSSQQLPNCFFNPNWDNSLDQSDPFESVLTSIVSSPVNSISGKISPGTYMNAKNNSNYPPKLNLSTIDHQIIGNFEKYSSNHLFKAAGSVSENPEFGDSMEESSVSEQIPGKDFAVKAQTHSTARKRKSIPSKNGDQISSSKAVVAKAVAENEESRLKRSKSDETSGNESMKQTKTENTKDYIHVRARRGQATDSHSLAERVRREKISERMKFLQDLVPGCNKVTGKAVMLDEIINYVQSLQSQVEFLSMKLSTVSPRTDVNTQAHLFKVMFQSNGSTNPNHGGDSAVLLHGLPYECGSQQYSNLHSNIHNGSGSVFSVNPSLSSAIRINTSLQVPHVDGFGGNPTSQASAFWEDGLQSFVWMDFLQNDPQRLQDE